jgi:hypothetical protein
MVTVMSPTMHINACTLEKRKRKNKACRRAFGGLLG